MFTDICVFDGYGQERSDQWTGRTVDQQYSPDDPVGFEGQAGYYQDWELAKSSAPAQYEYLTTTPSLLTHRYYDAGTGRFVSRDPIGYGGGENLYAYAGGNPVNEIDPDGTDAVIIYGADSKSGDTYFLNAAEALRDDYDAKHKGKHAYIYNAKSYLHGTLHGPAVFEFALTHTYSIDTIMWLGHAGITDDGSTPPIYVSKLYSGTIKSNDITTADIAHFSTKNVNKSASIFLFGCATAATFDPDSKYRLSPGQISMSQAFANHFHTNVQGFTRHVAFGRPFLDVFGEDYHVYHDHRDMISPTTISPSK